MKRVASPRSDDISDRDAELAACGPPLPLVFRWEGASRGARTGWGLKGFALASIPSGVTVPIRSISRCVATADTRRSFPSGGETQRTRFLTSFDERPDWTERLFGGGVLSKVARLRLAFGRPFFLGRVLRRSRG